jgi:hypothetical protein
MKYGAGVVVGRFQVSDLTRGHDELLHRVAREHTKVVVLLSVNANLSTVENPLGFESRERMLRDHWRDTIGKDNDKALLVAPLPDQPTSILWSEQIDSILDSLLGPITSKTLYGGRDSCLVNYHGKHLIGDIRTDEEQLSDEGFSAPGTSEEHRFELFDKPPMSETGRAGAIWAMGHQFSRINFWIYTAVTVNYGTSVGMLLKEDSLGKLCFPGRVVSRGDEIAESVAGDYIEAETGIQLDSQDWKYVVQKRIENWQDVSGVCTWATLLHTHLDPDGTSSLPGDKFVLPTDIGYIKPGDINGEHLSLWVSFKNYLDRIKTPV